MAAGIGIDVPLTIESRTCLTTLLSGIATSSAPSARRSFPRADSNGGLRRRCAHPRESPASRFRLARTQRPLSLGLPGTGTRSSWTYPHGLLERLTSTHLGVGSQGRMTSRQVSSTERQGLPGQTVLTAAWATRGSQDCLPRETLALCGTHLSGRHPALAADAQVCACWPFEEPMWICPRRSCTSTWQPKASRTLC